MSTEQEKRLEKRPAKISSVIFQGYTKRPSLAKTIDLLCRIARRCFNETALKYPDCDFYGDIEIRIWGGEDFEKRECVGRVERHYRLAQFYGNGTYYDLKDDRIIVYFPVGKNVKAVTLRILFADELHPDVDTQHFTRDLEAHIIAELIKWMPSGSKYYDRLSKKAKSETAYNVVVAHDPIPFELDFEADMYGGRYGFVSYPDREIFKKALARARAEGYYV